MVELKNTLKEVVIQEGDKHQVEQLNTKEELLGFATKLGERLTNKLEIELKTRDQSEPLSDTLDKLIKLRQAVTNSLKEQVELDQLNQFWVQVQQQNLAASQENAKKEEGLTSKMVKPGAVVLVLNALDDENRRLLELKNAKLILSNQTKEKEMAARNLTADQFGAPKPAPLSSLEKDAGQKKKLKNY